jgi:hypothetical protein
VGGEAVGGEAVGGEVDRLEIVARLAVARAEVEATSQRLIESRSRLAATRLETASGRTERQKLHEVAFARLQARLESQPVIEQAKGVLIARTACQPEEAFDILRRASQRTNVRVRDLAADIVSRASQGEKPVSAGRQGQGRPPDRHTANAR